MRSVRRSGKSGCHIMQQAAFNDTGNDTSGGKVEVLENRRKSAKRAKEARKAKEARRAKRGKNSKHPEESGYTGGKLRCTGYPFYRHQFWKVKKGHLMLLTAIVAERRLRWIVQRLLCSQTRPFVGQEGDCA